MNNAWYNSQQSFPADVTHPAPGQLIGPNFDTAQVAIPSQRQQPPPEPSPARSKREEPVKPDKKP
jgi:hypothetical protein